MRSAIMTRVTNNSDANIRLDFGSTGRYLIPARSKDIEIPADLWGIADYRRRSYISSNIAAGIMEVTLLVISTNGAYVEVPFMPHLVGAAPAVVSKTVDVEPATITKDIPTADKDTHTIVADAGESAKVAASMGLASEDVMAGAGADTVEDKGAFDSATGFTALETPAAVDATQVEASGVTVGDTESSAEATYNDYVANKQWEEAAGIIAANTGAEVKASALKACKDKSYSAMLEKYSAK